MAEKNFSQAAGEWCTFPKGLLFGGRAEPTLEKNQKGCTMKDIGIELHSGSNASVQILRSPRRCALELPRRRPLRAGKNPKRKTVQRLYTPYEMAKLLAVNATAFTPRQSDFGIW